MRPHSLRRQKRRECLWISFTVTLSLPMSSSSKMTSSFSAILESYSCRISLLGRHERMRAWSPTNLCCYEGRRRRSIIGPPRCSGPRESCGRLITWFRSRHEVLVPPPLKPPALPLRCRERHLHL